MKADCGSYFRGYIQKRCDKQENRREKREEKEKKRKEIEIRTNQRGKRKE